jgi:hypothetical protein
VWTIAPMHMVSFSEYMGVIRETHPAEATSTHIARHMIATIGFLDDGTATKVGQTFASFWRYSADCSSARFRSSMRASSCSRLGASASQARYWAQVWPSWYTRLQWRRVSRLQSAHVMCIIWWSSTKSPQPQPSCAQSRYPGTFCRARVVWNLSYRRNTSVGANRCMSPWLETTLQLP